MSSNSVTISADGTNQLMLTTKSQTAKVSLIMTSASTLGGGTLTYKVRPAGTDSTPETIDTPTAGLQATYQVGPNMDVFWNLTGATAPAITIMWAEIHS